MSHLITELTMNDRNWKDKYFAKRDLVNRPWGNKKHIYPKIWSRPRVSGGDRIASDGAEECTKKVLAIPAQESARQ
ncbi:hypothetical protein Q3G72_029407 [Acer saccharum]|nr:hypothetical protein Q3G72_029407 [Acer saccharum]